MLPRNMSLVVIMLAAAITTVGAETFNGVYTVDDSTNTGAQNFESITVGINGDGTFNILDGRFVQSASGMFVAVVNGPNHATGVVNVFGNHSRLEILGSVQIGSNNANPIRTAAGSLNVEAGAHVRAQSVGLSFGSQPNSATVMVSGSGSLLETITTLEIRQSSNGTSTIRIGTGGTVSVGTTILVSGSPRIILEGGTLSLLDPSLVPAAGIIQFNGGAYRFRSPQTLDGGTGFYTDTFGSPPVLGAGRGLIVDGTTTLATALHLDGGLLRTDRIVLASSSGSILLRGGTLTLTGERLVISDDTNLAVPAFTVGDGLDAAALVELAGAGDVLLGAVTLASDGALTFGGERLFVDSFDNGGSITVAEAAIHVDSLLFNAGSLRLADTIVEGSVASPAGSNIDVVGTVILNGAFSGAAAFHGSGTVIFNGPVSVD